MLGTFSPQAEPYTHVMEEETTPSGMFARGSYSARTKVNFDMLRSVILFPLFYRENGIKYLPITF